MKKVVSMLLCLLLVCLCPMAMAKDYAPGDTVTVTVSVASGNGAVGATIKVSGDSAGLEFSSASASMSGVAPSGNGGSFAVYSADFTTPLSGTVGTVTFKVKDSAATGTYKITVSCSSAYDGNDNSVSMSVSGSTTVNVVSNDECEHTWGDWKETTAATCDKDGKETRTCTKCEESEERTVKAKGHTPSAEAETVEPTCTEDGYATGKCTVCGKVLDKEVLPATGHKDDGGKETKAATCTEKGEKTYTCTVCDKVVKTEEIAALGHKDDGGKETKAATCTEKGEKTYTCTVCDEVVKTEEIAALGHKDDGGKETKAATCTEKGEKTYTCTVCDKVVKTEEIAALGHKDDGGKETKAATCTEKGEKTYTCTVCDEVVKTEEIAALGHKPGEWVIVKEATKEEDGLKEQYCTVCDVLVDSQVIPHAQWYSMTVSSVGIRFRDVSDITDKWDMFTPVDLSADGEQTFDLVAGNKHIIGEVTVKVAEGQVTVTYKPLNQVDMKNDFLTFFADLASVTTLDESQLIGYSFGEPVSIADQLGGDTKVLMYIHGNAVYRDDARGLEELPYKTKAYQQYIEELKAVMD